MKLELNEDPYTFVSLAEVQLYVMLGVMREEVIVAKKKAMGEEVIVSKMKAMGEVMK